MLFLAFVLLGIMFGYLRGGKLKNIPENISNAWLPLLAYSLEFIVGPPVNLYKINETYFLATAITVKYVFLLLFIVLNARYIKSAILLALGSIANFLVIALNGFKMPIAKGVMDIPAYENAVARVISGENLFYKMADKTTRLYFLSDILYVKQVWWLGIASVGDLLLYLGIFGLIQYAMVRMKRIKK